MSKKGFSASKAADVIGAGKAAFQSRDEQVLVHVVVDASCPRDLVLEARRLFVPERVGGRVEVRALSCALPVVDRPDHAIVLSGANDTSAVVAAYARIGTAVALVVEGALDAPQINLPEEAAALVSVVACSSSHDLGALLAARLAAATDKRLALAANFPFCRPAVVDMLISRCATENALVGAISLIPGSDLPVMFVNQAKLALDMAAAYGRGVDASRAAELAAVLAAGFGWREVARAALGALPGLGIVLRAGVGYAGTLATGSSLRLRFEAVSLPKTVRSRAAAAPGAPLAAQAASLPATQPDDGYIVIEEARA